MSDDKHEHYILPKAKAVQVLGLLLVFTVITVGAAQFDFGVLNFPLAMLIATIKALMVVMIFMGMSHDSNENRVIFGTSFVFVAIFIGLTATDLWTRAEWKTREVGQPAFKEVEAPSQFASPWNATPEIVAHGKTLYDVQCASCHGMKGLGDGPAAVALNPKPRKFSDGSGWKNGRKGSEIFKTLTEGLGGMPAFGSLPSGDRWALSHYVRTLTPNPPKDSTADLKKIGVDPSKEGGGQSKGAEKLPVDFAIERMSIEG